MHGIPTRFMAKGKIGQARRHYAKALGYSMSDHGIVRAQKVGGANIVRGTANVAPATCEADIFAALGLEYVPPSKR